MKSYFASTKLVLTWKRRSRRRSSTTSLALAKLSHQLIDRLTKLYLAELEFDCFIFGSNVEPKMTESDSTSSLIIVGVLRA